MLQNMIGGSLSAALGSNLRSRHPKRIGMSTMDVVMVADEASAAPALLPWVEKYRPSSLDQLVAHEDIIRMIERMMKKQTLPHMLLHGPPGTGAVWGEVAGLI